MYTKYAKEEKLCLAVITHQTIAEIVVSEDNLHLEQ